MELIHGAGERACIYKRCTSCTKTSEWCSMCVAVKRDMLGRSPAAEADMLKRLNDIVGVDAHIVRYISHNDDSLVMEFIPPVSIGPDGRIARYNDASLDVKVIPPASATMCTTLASLLWIENLDPNILQDIILQVTSTLMCVQQSIPGFRHGDLHAENVLVTPWPTSKPLSRCVLEDGIAITLGSSGVMAVIVDFGDVRILRDDGHTTHTVPPKDVPHWEALQSPAYDIYRLALSLARSPQPRSVQQCFRNVFDAGELFSDKGLDAFCRPCGSFAVAFRDRHLTDTPAVILEKLTRAP